MQEFTYAQVTSMLCAYLEQYPHVGVALEVVLEIVEGDGRMAHQILNALERINAGESDVAVLESWANETGSRDLMILSQRIAEARAKGQDIGYYVKRFMPGAALAKKQENSSNFRNQRNNRNNRNGYRGNKRFNNRRPRS